MALSAVARTRPTWPRVVLIVLGGWVLLAVPIALASPGFAPFWLLPLGFWALPMKSGGELWRIAIAAGLAAAIVGLAARPRPTTSA